MHDKKIRVKTKARELSRSSLISMMARDNSNAKGMVIFKVTVLRKEHSPSERLKNSTIFTWKQVRERMNWINKLLSKENIFFTHGLPFEARYVI